MPDLARHLALPLLALALTGLLLDGCGDDAPSRRTTATTAGPAARDQAATEPAVEEGDDGDAVITPTPAARATDARFRALLREYAPVTARINFLVTAETLREDAVAARASEKTEFERYGSVRLEVLRMEPMLRGARSKVADVAVTSEEQHVQDLMLEAIDARLRALGELKLALDASGAEETPASEAERLEDQWRASWDESLRAAREATTSMQDTRARLGLEPAPEDGIR
jgi:hypothetical protein